MHHTYLEDIALFISSLLFDITVSRKLLKLSTKFLLPKCMLQARNKHMGGPFIFHVFQKSFLLQIGQKDCIFNLNELL